MSHKSVLLHESIEGLAIREGDVFVDGTLGDGGHSAEVLKRFGDKVTIVGIDRDEDALKRAEENLGRVLSQVQAEAKAEDLKKIFFKQGNFRDIEQILNSIGLNEAQRFLFDIGMSSN